MKTIITTLLLLLCTCSYAQYTTKDAMARVKVQKPPFDDTKISSTILGQGIEVEDGELSRKVYSNAQLTEWWDMKECPDFSYYCMSQIDNPSHQNNYFLISLNDAGDFWTHILASVDPDGNIEDCIDARVAGCVFLNADCRVAPIMQYRIAVNGDVIISRIVPTSSTSIPLGDLKDFHGHRQDTTYRLDQNGKFQVVDVVKFIPQLYTAHMLSSKEYRIWNGNETPAQQ